MYQVHCTGTTLKYTVHAPLSSKLYMHHYQEHCTCATDCTCTLYQLTNVDTVHVPVKVDTMV